jgi:stress response protein YsnF
VPVTREEVTVDRRPSEEVEVGKRAMHDRQNVSATVRKEVVDVDADGTCRWNLTPPSASNTRNPTPLS